MEEQNPKNESLQFNSRIDLSKLQEAVAKIKNELGKVIIGQENMIELLIISILADGHSLRYEASFFGVCNAKSS